MPDRMIQASTGALAALERELTCARALLQTQRELEAAIRGGRRRPVPTPSLRQ